MEKEFLFVSFIALFSLGIFLSSCEKDDNDKDQDKDQKLMCQCEYFIDGTSITEIYDDLEEYDVVDCSTLETMLEEAMLELVNGDYFDISCQEI